MAKYAASIRASDVRGGGTLNLAVFERKLECLNTQVKKSPEQEVDLLQECFEGVSVIRLDLFMFAM